MLRFLTILTVIAVPIFGIGGTAFAEMAHPNFGIFGADTTGSKIAQPFAGISAPLAPPTVDMPPPNFSGRMAISPDLLAAQREMFLAEYLAEAKRDFWTYIAILSALFISSAYLLGRGVVKRGWRVGYTRKGQALALYFLPYVAMQGPSPYSAIETATISLGVFILLLMLLSAPVRNRIPAMATAFAAIDRPEDRPFTLVWLITSVLAAWSVIVLWLWLAPETAMYLFVALFISGIGDALAEPVGLYFGKHSYETRALGTDRTYIRTYEGSAVVFFSGVVAVFIVHGLSPDVPTLLALATFPIVGAIAEAKSPHTWDQPFIIASCAAVAICLSFV